MDRDPGIGFNEADHTYTLDGESVPGVTSLLEPLYDFRFVDQAVLEKSRDMGKKVHKTVELFEEGVLDRNKLHPLLDAHLEQWLKFKEDFRFLPRRHEVVVASRKYKFAGQLDCEGLLLPVAHDANEEPLLLDIKTGAQYAPHTLQTAGYKVASCEMGILPDSTKRASLYLAEDGYDFRWHNNPFDLPAFLSLLTINHWRRHHGKK